MPAMIPINIGANDFSGGGGGNLMQQLMALLQGGGKGAGSIGSAMNGYDDMAKGQILQTAMGNYTPHSPQFNYSDIGGLANFGAEDDPQHQQDIVISDAAPGQGKADHYWNQAAEGDNVRAVHQSPNPAYGRERADAIAQAQSLLDTVYPQKSAAAAVNRPTAQSVDLMAQLQKALADKQVLHSKELEKAGTKDGMNSGWGFNTNSVPPVNKQYQQDLAPIMAQVRTLQQAYPDFFNGQGGEGGGMQSRGVVPPSDGGQIQSVVQGLAQKGFSQNMIQAYLQNLGVDMSGQ